MRRISATVLFEGWVVRLAFLGRRRASHIPPSTGAVGTAYETAVAASFFGTFEGELAHRQRFASRGQARTAILDCIEVFYNRQRRHSRANRNVSTEREQARHQTSRSEAPSRLVHDHASVDGILALLKRAATRSSGRGTGLRAVLSGVRRTEINGAVILRPIALPPSADHNPEARFPGAVELGIDPFRREPAGADYDGWRTLG